MRVRVCFLGFRSQGLEHAWQVFYQWTIPPALSSTSYFEAVPVSCPGWSWAYSIAQAGVLSLLPPTGGRITGRPVPPGSVLLCGFRVVLKFYRGMSRKQLQQCPFMATVFPHLKMHRTLFLKFDGLHHSLSMMVRWVSATLLHWNPSGDVIESTSITH